MEIFCLEFKFIIEFFFEMYPLVVIKEGKIVDGATTKSTGYSYGGSKDWEKCSIITLIPFVLINKKLLLSTFQKLIIFSKIDLQNHFNEKSFKTVST